MCRTKIFRPRSICSTGITGPLYRITGSHCTSITGSQIPNDIKILRTIILLIGVEQQLIIRLTILRKLLFFFIKKNYIQEMTFKADNKDHHLNFLPYNLSTFVTNDQHHNILEFI